MKKNRFYILIVTIMLLVSSCDEDSIGITLLEEVPRGVALRTVGGTPISSELNIGEATSSFIVELEIQGRDAVPTINVFSQFLDNTSENGPGNGTEQMVETLSTDGFELGPFQFPRFTYEADFASLASSSGIALSDAMGGDEFRIRFELVLADGRTLSVEDNTGNLTGNFFSSPFQYTATVVCPPTVPTAGTWVFNLQDSFGDGWNGASLSVNVDGTVSTLTIDAGGAVADIDFEVPAGSQTISVIYNSGAFDGENTFQVTSANGIELLNLGPTPVSGVELLNFCLDNL